MQEVVIMKEESMDIKEMTVKRMKEYVKDVMVLRQTLIIGGMPENEIDEIIRIEGTERMKRYASMGEDEFFIEVIADVTSRALAAIAEKEKHPSETE